MPRPAQKFCIQRNVLAHGCLRHPELCCATLRCSCALRRLREGAITCRRGRQVTTPQYLQRTKIVASVWCDVCHYQKCNGPHVDISDTPCHALYYMWMSSSGSFKTIYSVSCFSPTYHVSLRLLTLHRSDMMLLIDICAFNGAGHTMITYEEAKDGTP